MEDIWSEVIWVSRNLDLPPGDTLNTVEAGSGVAGRVQTGACEADRRRGLPAPSRSTETSATATAQASVFVVRAGVAVTKTAGIAGDALYAGNEGRRAGGEEWPASASWWKTPATCRWCNIELTDPLLELDATFVYTLPPAGATDDHA